MPMMPYTGQYDQADGEDTFVQAFSERAFGILQSRYPSLMEHVATFKVIEADLSTGQAVGAFLLTIGGEVLYIPVVLGDGELRPLIMMYHKRADNFIPLNNQWLERIMSEVQPSLGDPSVQPPTLTQDVSLRTLVRPPNLVGRFAYAADDSYAIKCIKTSPPNVKKAYADLLKDSPTLLQHAVEVYGLDLIKEAIAGGEAKTAAAVDLPSEVVVFDGDPKKVDSTQFKEVFGERAPEAYAKMVSKGTAVYDSRDKGKLNTVARLDLGGHYEQIRDPGVYEVVSVDGTAVPVFALRDTGHYSAAYDGDPKTLKYQGPGEAGGDGPQETRLLLVKGDGKLMRVKGALGRPLKPEALKNSKIYNVLFAGKSREARSGQEGVFLVRKENGNWAHTDKVRVSNVYSEDKIKHYVCHDHHYIVDPQVPVKVPRDIGHRGVTYLPTNCTWLRMEPNAKAEGIVNRPDTLAALLHTKLTSRGATKLKVVRTGDSAYSLDGMPSVERGKALRELLDKDMAHCDVEVVLKAAADDKQAEVWLIPPGQKEASIFADPGMDEQGMGMGMPMQGMGMQQQQPELPVSYGDDISIDPRMMQMVQQAQMEDPAMLDAAIVASLARVPELRELVLGYLPNLKQAMDNFGRILLAVWIHQEKVREQLGDTAFSGLEDTLVATFKALGEAILQLSDGSDTLSDQPDNML